MPRVRNNPILPTPTAIFPIERIFANGNSIPITKSNSITPISANMFRADISDNIPIAPLTCSESTAKNEVHNGESGPIYIPANR